LEQQYGSSYCRARETVSAITRPPKLPFPKLSYFDLKEDFLGESMCKKLRNPPSHSAQVAESKSTLFGAQSAHIDIER
jgi:hypothetical protein